MVSWPSRGVPGPQPVFMQDWPHIFLISSTHNFWFGNDKVIIDSMFVCSDRSVILNVFTGLIGSFSSLLGGNMVGGFSLACSFLIVSGGFLGGGASDVLGKVQYGTTESAGLETTSEDSFALSYLQKSVPQTPLLDDACGELGHARTMVPRIGSPNASFRSTLLYVVRCYWCSNVFRLVTILTFSLIPG